MSLQGRRKIVGSGSVTYSVGAYEAADVSPGIRRAYFDSTVCVFPLVDAGYIDAIPRYIQAGSTTKAYVEVEHWPHLRTGPDYPDWGSLNIGGSSSVIWFIGQYDYDPHAGEISPSDFSIIRHSQVSYRKWTRIGGDENVIWGCDTYNEDLMEIDTTDFSVIRSKTNIVRQGLDGSFNVIWATNYDYVEERSPSDFSVVQTKRYTFIDGNYPATPGGNQNTLWLCDGHNYMNYEVYPSDLTIYRDGALEYQLGSVAGDASALFILSGGAVTAWVEEYTTADPFVSQETIFS